jgi:hypothetical protein
LARPEWLPAAPIPLDQVGLTWRAGSPDRGINGTEPESEAVRPRRADGTRFPSYAGAVSVLRTPGLFEDRPCYRIIDVRTSPAAVSLEFSNGSYFDIINVCEATAHEYAAAALATADPSEAALPLRTLVGDPTDLRRRSVIPAISTLILRADRASADVRMILHWRDPAKVASGGGLYQVAPVGVFQPSGDAPWNWSNDFSLWRAITRELSEELLGTDEDYRSEVRPIDYERWPFYAALDAARRTGALEVYWLGLGIDPLTLVTDMLTVAVIDSAAFDTIFAQLVTTNEEGHLLVDQLPDSANIGVPFDSATIERFVSTEPMQPAGAALLRLAWNHRTTLLARSP